MDFGFIPRVFSYFNSETNFQKVAPLFHFYDIQFNFHLKVVIKLNTRHVLLGWHCAENGT